MGLKGLETINNFSVKHNELHPEKKLPIFEFDGSKRYVHTDCRKRHTNTRRYEQTKRKREDESGDVGPTAVFRSALIAAYAAGLLIKLKQYDFLETSITSIAVLCP